MIILLRVADRGDTQEPRDFKACTRETNVFYVMSFVSRKNKYDL